LWWFLPISPVLRIPVQEAFAAAIADACGGFLSRLPSLGLFLF
jgi:hypothetical protein